ncbi:MAG: hypothetical protein EUB_03915 [Eubacterium sp.]|uniref:hypothetical protein n=1 Tax=Eubacterium sp. TaxID=142586 RepID=UPI00302263CB
MKATVKARDLPAYRLAPWAMKYSVDREKGIPVETQFKGTRMFIVQDHLLIISDSTGEALTIALENIHALVAELMDIEEMYGRNE